VLNIGHSEEVSILQLAKSIIRITKSKSKIVHHPPLKEGDMIRRQPDNAKMRQLLNREPYSLDDGIRKMIAEGKF
jgi:UDP-glucose 4-epimerase